jgi:preprotein translocase subunit Sss1
MEKKELKQKLEGYVEDQPVDVKMKTLEALLSACEIEELSGAISDLKNQIPVTISELRGTISRNTERIIDSNKALSESNEEYSNSMNWLTLALVVVGIIGIIVSILK